MQIYKTSGRTDRRKSSRSWVRQRFYTYAMKSTIQERKKLINWPLYHQENENKPQAKEKIFANHKSDKRFASRIYKEQLQFNNKDNTILF